MADDQPPSERRVLDQRPDVREAVLRSSEFQAWQRSLPSVVVDDVQYFIRGGDMLKDEDQVIVEWARRHGLLSDRPAGGEGEPG
jgi:hypothetical protein